MGDRKKQLDHALSLINKELGEVRCISAVYESEPWGFISDSNFLNQVLMIACNVSPSDLLLRILNIEKMMGRVRQGNFYTSRPIDIDILYYGSMIIDFQNLQIPHPHLANRRFVVEPLCDIAPDFIHPILNMTNRKLLTNCFDTAILTKINP